MEKPCLKTQPNENRCSYTIETHIVALPSCCPVSHNPQAGSTIAIRYRARFCVLEVESLVKYLDSYIGGRGPIRSMEGMIQQITSDCAKVLRTTVEVRAELNLLPEQKMILECKQNG